MPLRQEGMQQALAAQLAIIIQFSMMMPQQLALFLLMALTMNGVTYGDLNVPFTNKMLFGADQAGYDGDMDMQLNPGQEVFEVKLAEGNFR